MTQFHKQAQSHAIQTLDHLNHIRRIAFCPKHNQQSSNFQGADVHGWMFRCNAKPDHMSHLFYVKPDKTAPKAAEEIPAWMEAQLQAKVRKMEKGA